MKWIAMLASALLVACAGKLHLVDFDGGQSLSGHYNKITKEVVVAMPDGEVLRGRYSDMPGMSMALGSAFGTSGASSAHASGQSIALGSSANAYALLSSESSKLMMEIKVIYSQWGGGGYGEAVTNDGRKFKIQL